MISDQRSFDVPPHGRYGFPMKKTPGTNKGIGEDLPESTPLPKWRTSEFRANIADREAPYRVMEEGLAAALAKPHLQQR